MADIPEKEIALFDALRDPEFNNFVLGTGGEQDEHLVIYADHGDEGSEEVDPDKLEPLFIRITPDVLAALGLVQDEVEGRVTHSSEVPKSKRWPPKKAKRGR